MAALAALLSVGFLGVNLAIDSSPADSSVAYGISPAKPARVVKTVPPKLGIPKVVRAKSGAITVPTSTTRPAVGSALRVAAPLCPPLSSQRAARTIFENRRTEIEGAAYGPDRFADLASLITPVVEMAANCVDVELLDRLSELLVHAPESLSTDPDGRPIWSENGVELRLVSSEFLMVSSRVVEAILGLPAAKRTPKMLAYAGVMLPIIAVHVDRWINKATFVGHGGCSRPRVAVGHIDYIALLRSRSMGSELSYCNVVDDVDLLIMGTAAQLARSSANDPVAADLAKLGVDRSALVTYLQKSADLIGSRLVTTTLRDYDGRTISGRDFDPGVFRDLIDDNQWAGYTGPTFPLSATALLVPQISDARAGWDLSHASRLVPVLAAFRRARPITGSTFPEDAVMTGLANQLAFATMVGTREWPKFSNYLSGLNGWYRVIYRGRTGFGYGPSDIGNAAFLEGGYGLWGVWSKEVAALTKRMGTIMQASDPLSVEFRSKNIGLLWDNFSRVGGVNADRAKSWTVMRFEASAIIDQNGTRLVDSDADGDGAPDYLEIQTGADPLTASSGALQAALASGRVQKGLRPSEPASSPSVDSDGDGISDLEELRCGSNPLDEADRRPGCPPFPAEPR